MFLSIDQSGKMPSVWRSPATSATGSLTLASRPSPRRGEELAEHLGLALAAEPGEPDDLAAVGGELAPVRLRRRRARAPGRPFAPLRRERHRLGGRGLGDAAHRRHQAVAA